MGNKAWDTWGNYIRQPQLDSRYIEQMANAIATRYDIEVIPGNTWVADIGNKKLIYAVSDLTSVTREELLAILLHEVGHLVHSTEPQGIRTNSIYLDKYFENASMVLHIFDDFRVDRLMIEAYQGAHALLATNKQLIADQGRLLLKRGQQLRKYYARAYVSKINYAKYMFGELGTQNLDSIERLISDLDYFSKNGEGFIQKHSNIESDLFKLEILMARDIQNHYNDGDMQSIIKATGIKGSIKDNVKLGNSIELAMNLAIELQILQKRHERANQKTEEQIKVKMDKVLHELNSFIWKAQFRKDLKRLRIKVDKWQTNYVTAKLEALVEDKAIMEELKKISTVADYLGALLLGWSGGGLAKFRSLPDDIIKLAQDTAPILDLTKELETTGDILAVLDKEIYPKVEYLLKQQDENSIENMSPSMVAKIVPSMVGKLGHKTAKQILIEAIRSMNNNSRPLEGQTSRTQGTKNKSNGQAPGRDGLPKEWLKGEYEPLRSSVSTQIDELIRRLMNIRKTDLTHRWQAEQKRGKLDTKSLYRFPQGNTRLFRQKLESIDRTRQVSFSILMDYSGSMSGKAQVESIRGLVVVGEALSKLEIPFEIIFFDHQALTIKELRQEFTPRIKKDLAGMATKSGGGTSLVPALDQSALYKRKEPNKIMFVFTDGYISKDDLKIRLEKNLSAGVNIRSFSIGFRGNPIPGLGPETNEHISDIAKAPAVFGDIIKDAILYGKKGRRPRRIKQ